MRIKVKSFLLISVCLISAACSSSTERNIYKVDLSSANSDNLNNFSSKISCSQLALNMDSLTLSTVKDIAFGDSAVYVLDMSASIAKIPYDLDGHAFTVNRRGVGAGEYISPVAIEAFDDYIYILDIATATVHRYDSELSPINSIKLSNPADDFTVTRDYIIVSNIGTSDNVGKFTVYSMDGRVVSNSNEDSYEYDIPSFKVCSNPLINVDGTVYALDGEYNRIYILNNGKLLPEFEYDFGEKAKPSDVVVDSSNFSKYAMSTDCFHIGDITVLSYLVDNKRQYCFFDRNTGSINNGAIPETYDGQPFYPRWQNGNKLVGYIEPDNPEENGVLLFYSIDSE